MTIAKKVISYVLALILSILLIAIVLIACISTSLLDKTYIKTAFQKSDYYYGIYDIIQDDMKSDIMPSGFEENVLDNVVTQEKVQQDINRLIDSLYDNKKFEVSVNEMRDTLDENVKKQANEKNFQITEENKKDIEEFENSIINIYKDNISYSVDAINQISGYIAKAQKIVKISMCILCIIAAALAFVIFKLNKPAVGISLIVAGMFFAIINAYSGTAFVVNNILMFNWAFSKSIIYVINKLLEKMVTVGVVMVIVGIIEVVVTEYFIAKELKRYKRI